MATGRNDRLSCITRTAILLMLAGLQAGFSFDKVLAEDRQVLANNRIHGPTDFLRQNLVQSQSDARLLSVARRSFLHGDGDTAFQALLEIFAQPFDSFSPIAEGKASSSIYQEAYHLLVASDPSTQRLWIQFAEPLATVALKDVANGTLSLENLARRFPATPTGTKALATIVAVAHSRGQRDFSSAVINRFPQAASPSLRRLKDQLNQVMPIETLARMAGGNSEHAPSKLSLPWMNERWTWEERLWSHPQLMSFSTLMEPVARWQLSWNSWQPVLHRESIFLKTPARVVAFDKRSGKINWTLQTDTLKPSARNGFGDRSGNQSSPPLNDILQRDDMGTVAVSDNHVFFIDRFRVFESNPQRFQFRNPNQMQFRSIQQPPSDQQQGTRLVAVRRVPEPTIAWTVGDAPRFEYHIVLGDVSTSTSSATADSVAKPFNDAESERSPFHGQRFCGVPVAHEQMLYVITRDRETYWLNCLSEVNGQLNWSRPLAYENGGHNQAGRLFSAPQKDTGASLCGIAGDVVVCALSNGLVIGAHIADGQLLWATNLRDVVPPSGNNRLRQVLAASLNVAPGIRSRPMLHGNRMYWAAPFSNKVHCVDTSTGAIRWSTVRANGGLGSLEASSDRYVAGISSGKVICVGNRHVRALDAETGTELWVTSISEQTGRAFCNDDTCLLPLRNGQLAQVDLNSGQLDSAAQVVRFANNQIGAVVADEEIVCVATPTSIAVSSSISEWQSEPKKRSKLETARAELLSGNFETAVPLLRQVAGKAETGDSAKAKQLLVASLLGNSIGHKAEFAVNALASLRQIDLTPEQRLSVAIALKDNRADTSSLMFDGPLPQLNLSADWNVRADVGAWHHLEKHQASQVFAAANDSTQITNIEQAVLFPSRLGNVDAQIRYAEALVSDSRYAAAEMLLLTAVRKATATADIKALTEQVGQLRESCLESSTGQIDGEANAVKINRLNIEQRLELLSDDPISKLRERIRAHVDSPEWFPYRLFLGSRSLIAASFEFGTVAHEFMLPGPVDAGKRPLDISAPSIVPVVGQSAVGAISLINPNGPQLLWWQPVVRSEFDISPIRLGSFGSDFLMVSTGTHVICLHPATGNELWRREHHDNGARQGMLYRFPEITGNSSVLAAFGQRLKSYEAMRTGDGMLLDEVAVDIPEGQVPLTSGQTILFHQDRVLVLHDLLSHKNLLANQPQIKVLGAGQAQLLSDERAITITEDLDLLIIEMKTGTIQLKCDLSKLIAADKLVGLDAFERDGRLFVVLKDWNVGRTRKSASSRMGEEKLDSGLLCCIDPVTQAVVWSCQIDSCVAPVIYGPKTNLMVMWTRHNPTSLLQQRLGESSIGSSSPNVQPWMAVNVLDVDNGKVVAEARHLNPAEPVRCAHNPTEKTIQLISPTAVIEMKYD